MRTLFVVVDGWGTQRRSFAYGNVAIGNPRVTREMIDEAADGLGKPQSSSPSR